MFSDRPPTPRGGIKDKYQTLLNPGFQKHSVFLVFVPILNVVSTASADILDTIQRFYTLLSLATPNQEMFFTQIHLVNDSKNYACGEQK